MKIAIFSDCYLDLTGGIVSSINAQKTALEKNGHTVYIFSTGYPKNNQELEKLKSQNIFVVPSCKHFLHGITPVSRRPKIVEAWLLKTCPELKEFDVFYVHYEAGCSIAGLRLARKLGIPSVQVMHGREDMGEKSLIPFGFRTIVAVTLNGLHASCLPHTKKVKKDDYLADTFAKAKMWNLMVNHAVFADALITPSEHFARKLGHYGARKKIWILPNGFPDQKFLKKPKVRTLKAGETLKIIWHSRVSREKRIMPFLETLEKLQGKYHLDVYGDGPDLKRAKKFVKDHQLDVTFHGNASFETVQKAIQDADLDVLVSYNFDDYPSTLVEAEAAGLPVFICDPDMEEVIPAKSYLISKNETPEKMAESLNTIFAHPDKIAKMSKIMLKERDEVLMSNRIKLLEKIFNGIIKK
ncbi:glycosyltransferase [Candidatus Saccharibacteria bacterium]|nr:glycosyltransferase [Candidatus Saccharibacteria bacterium]